MVNTRELLLNDKDEGVRNNNVFTSYAVIERAALARLLLLAYLSPPYVLARTRLAKSSPRARAANRRGVPIPTGSSDFWGSVQSALS